MTVKPPVSTIGGKVATFAAAAAGIVGGAVAAGIGAGIGWKDEPATTGLIGMGIGASTAAITAFSVAALATYAAHKLTPAVAEISLKAVPPSIDIGLGPGHIPGISIGPANMDIIQIPGVSSISLTPAEITLTAPKITLNAASITLNGTANIDLDTFALNLTSSGSTKCNAAGFFLEVDAIAKLSAEVMSLEVSMMGVRSGNWSDD